MRYPPPFNLMVVSPGVGVTPDALGGAAPMVLHGLRGLGLPARVVVNEYLRDATNIVFAAHNLDPSLVEVLPTGSIVYNTEMVVPGSPFIASMLPFVRAFETWDYSPTNVRRWEAMGLGARVRLVRPAYLPHYTVVRIDAPRDVDVLFYGMLGARRQGVLESIARTGVRLKVLIDVWGDELNAWIERSRLLVNIHHRGDAVFETARMSKALANRRCFVSEAGSLDDVDPSLLPGFVTGDVGDLPSICRALVDDDLRREDIAQRGFDLYRATDFSRTLAEVLGVESRGR